MRGKEACERGGTKTHMKVGTSRPFLANLEKMKEVEKKRRTIQHAKDLLVKESQ